MNATTQLNKSINVLIADDHPAVRYGLNSIFELDDVVHVCGEAENGLEVLDLVEKIQPDVIMMDVNMPSMDGVETTKKLRKSHPDLKILAFSMYDDQQKVLTALKAGVHGYLLKSASREEIISALEAIMRGDQYITKEIADKVVYYMITKQQKEVEEEATMEFGELSGREKDVLRLIAADNTYKEIAQKLQISKRTVDTHRYNISKKLGIKSIAGLIKYAMTHDI